MPISDPSSFHAEARYQGFCAVTGLPGPFEAHHVIYEQHLARLGIAKVDRHDTRDALRLSPKAHSNHHARIRVVCTQELLTCNIEYAVEVFDSSDRAVEYLRRYYDDTHTDPRLEALLAA